MARYRNARTHANLEEDRELINSLRFKAMQLEKTRSCPIRKLMVVIPKLLFDMAQAFGFSRRCERPKVMSTQAKIYPGYVVRGVNIKSPAA